ncbi:hypothetical protein [Klebsiella phage MY01]|nr:hypothetical protein [Pseudomonas phage MY01]
MNAQLVEIQCRLGVLQAELEAMKIANLRRLSDNYSEAYDEEAFFYIASQMEALAQRAVEISHEG